MTDIAFVDVETTGLDPKIHTILELALIRHSDGETIHRWLDLTDGELGKSTTQALKLNHYWQRELGVEKSIRARHGEYLDITVGTYVDDQVVLAKDIARLTNGCILAGNTVKFDQAFLEEWLRRHGACPTWDYHVLDVPTFAAGAMCAILSSSGADESVFDLMQEAIKPPFKSSKVSKALEIPVPEGDEAHTALGDASWSRAMYEKARKL